MHKKPIQAIRRRDLAAAQRGVIVQRVLVDGWTPEEAGSLFGVDGQSVARWVAAYRRHGMIALRRENAAEGGLRHSIACCLAWIGAWPRGIGGAKTPVARLADSGDSAGTDGTGSRQSGV